MVYEWGIAELIHVTTNIEALVQFRTGPMTDGVKRCWCMHITSGCVRLCALFRQASAWCETALAPNIDEGFEGKSSRFEYML